MFELPGYDEELEYQRADELAAEVVLDLDIEDEYSEFDIAGIFSEWAVENNSRGGLIMQIATHHEFGAVISEYTRKLISGLGMDISADWSTERAIVRWLHENSRRHPMTLYRGIDPQCETNGLESWTDDRSVAEFYAERNDGHVVERTFQPNEILATWQDGIGLECAREVIIINRRSNE